MSIKHILVPVEDATDEPRVHSALGLARSLGVHLTGLHVIPSASPRSITDRGGLPVGTAPEAFEMHRQLERRREQNRISADDAEKRFRRLARESGVDIEWTTTIGDTLAALTMHSLFADIVVVGQNDRRSDGARAGGLPDRLVMQASCPLLVVPNANVPRAFGERVLIAWRDDAQAKRSVHASVPLLQRARRVEVVSVAVPSRRLTQGSPARRSLRKYLAMHSVSSDFHELPVCGPIGDTLLGRAIETGSDLVIMGAYHHSRIKENLLGGVTRHVLRNAKLPVLLAH